ncbi:unnamed protein product [Cyprideis torosa]|uniref:Uncharacterized protein n=1 Tax=Cyprideis torosa TaxID=163714 RepID=A0A7R8WD01_9CRUS|nr:unnamed protein product [Cyprideis torosa]CAG0891497.1 unnamed protein product [Cyprideis torosa]
MPSNLAPSIDEEDVNKKILRKQRLCQGVFLETGEDFTYITYRGFRYFFPIDLDKHANVFIKGIGPHTTEMQIADGLIDTFGAIDAVLIPRWVGLPIRRGPHSQVGGAPHSTQSSFPGGWGSPFDAVLIPRWVGLPIRRSPHSQVGGAPHSTQSSFPGGWGSPFDAVLIPRWVGLPIRRSPHSQVGGAPHSTRSSFQGGWGSPFDAVLIPRNTVTGEAHGVAIIAFRRLDDAVNAVSSLSVIGLHIRMVDSPELDDRSVYLGRLPPSLDHEGLLELVTPYGLVLGTKILVDTFGKSKCTAFVK